MNLNNDKKAIKDRIELHNHLQFMRECNFTNTVPDFFCPIQNSWKKKDIPMRLSQALNVFPQGKKAAKLWLREKIEEFNSLLGELTIFRRNELNNAGTVTDPETKKLFTEWAKDTEVFEKNILRKIHRLEFTLYTLTASRSKTEQWYKDAAAKLEAAKSIPVESLYEGNLKKRNNTLVGVCELHNDKDPSFIIYTETNSWYCFGESAGGDTIDYCMKKHNLSFKDALTFLCKRSLSIK